MVERMLTTARAIVFAAVVLSVTTRA